MTARGLARSVADDLRRHLRHLLAGGVGIAVSVAALTFFLGLGLGVRAVLLGDIFPMDRLEVHRPATDLSLLAIKIQLGKDTIDEARLAQLAAIDGVAEVYPKMRLLVPATATGGDSLFGAGLQTELVADGVAPALVAGTVGDDFHDPMLDPSTLPGRCRSDGDCPAGAACVAPSSFTGGRCREVIPVIVSEHMVELYNGAFRRAYRLPKVDPEALIGLGIEVRFGASSLRPIRGRVLSERLRLVGTSDAAIPLGVTMPLGFVRRLNRELGPAGAADGYHSAVLTLTSKDAAARVAAAAERMGLEVRDTGARRAASLMAILLAVVAVIGAVILAVAALHVMHVFALLTIVRRREIAVMRAVGASRGDVRLLLVAEAAVVGLAAGASGVAAAVLLGALTDHLMAAVLPDIPFAPETLFVFPAWLLAGGVVMAGVSCVLGALGPVLLATGSDPAEGLASA